MNRVIQLVLILVVAAALAGTVYWQYSLDSAQKKRGLTTSSIDERAALPLKRPQVSGESIDIRTQKAADLGESGEGRPGVASSVSDFNAAQHCAHVYRQYQLFKGKEKACKDYKDASSCPQQGQGTDSEITALESDVRKCGGVGATEFEDIRYQLVEEEAKKGDVDAQVCFVQSDFDLRKFRKFSQENMGQYKTEASAYIEAAMARGDWRIPALFTLSSQAIAHSHGLLWQIAKGDDMTVYRMTRLLRLGAVGDYALELDRKLAEFTQARANGLEGYAPEQLAEEDEWARQQYIKNFSNSPPLAYAPVVCN